MSIFEQFLNTNILNFIIVIATLIWIFKKAHLGDLIEQAALDIKSKVEKSSADTQNAINEYKNAKKDAKQTPTLKAEIIDNAKINAQNLKENIELKTTNTIDEIKSGLNKIYSSQAQKQKSLTLNAVYNACVELAYDEVKNNLNEQLQKKLIDSAIVELEKI